MSVSPLSTSLTDCRLISQRSYSFFGKMLIELPESFKHREQELIENRAPNGLDVPAIGKTIDKRTEMVYAGSAFIRRLPMLKPPLAGCTPRLSQILRPSGRIGKCQRAHWSTRRS